MCRHHLSTGRFGSLFDSAVFITFPPVIASMIEHNHLLCTGIETLLNNFRYQFRIGISCQFGHFIPTDIRFDNHFLSGFDKFPHTSEFSDCFPEHFCRFTTHYGDQIASPGLRSILCHDIHHSIPLHCHSSPCQG